VYPTPAWEDLVELAFDEIRAFGAGQYQVARRLRALLDALAERVADVPEKRRPALVEPGALGDDTVSSAIPQSQRADALVPDRQGIGMSRHRPIDGHQPGPRGRERDVKTAGGDGINVEAETGPET
jgi:hypothetical protein